MVSNSIRITRRGLLAAGAAFGGLALGLFLLLGGFGGAGGGNAVGVHLPAVGLLQVDHLAQQDAA